MKPSASAGQVIRCRGAVAWKAREPLVVEEIEVEPPQAGEVRIKITHTSLCHTDVLFWENEVLFPRILGHEASGVVESVGEGVTGLQAGEHVVTVLAGECGECRQCRSSKTNLCSTLLLDPLKGVMAADGTTRFSITLTKRQLSLKQPAQQSQLEGEADVDEVVRLPLFHFLNVSSFTEYTVVDAGCVAKIPPLAPLDKACLFACAVPSGVGAVWNIAKVEKDSCVVIFGLGAVGLAVAEGARIAGASRIIGLDINPHKFELAKQFGVTEFLNPKECTQPIENVIQELTNGGADYSFECVGSVDLVMPAFESTHKGWGKTILVGIDMGTRPISIPALKLFEGREIKGSIVGSFKRSQIPGLVDKYMDKVLHVDKLVTHEVPLADINKAFELLLGGKSLRCVIHMAHDYKSVHST